MTNDSTLTNYLNIYVTGYNTYNTIEYKSRNA